MYNVCPCFLCDKPLSFEALRESVNWAPKSDFGNWWKNYWSDSEDSEMHFAHKACWKKLSEARREYIREGSDRKFVPKTLNQLA
jgi:hypothetical protein